MAAHAAADRTVGVLAPPRLGGYAAERVHRRPAAALAALKTGSRLVHGRAAAGGWSQHRFARRRENWATAALRAAGRHRAGRPGAVRYGLDAVVLGDRRAMASLRADPRLAPFMARAVGRFLTVPDPRLAVLKDTAPLPRSGSGSPAEPG